MPLTERERQNILEKIEQLVETKFYDPTFKGRDWPAIVERHRTEILAATDSQGFESAVNEMLRELRSGGLGLISATSKITPKNSISATFRAADTEYGHRWVFQDVHEGGPADAAGIASGDVLISDGDRDIAPPEKPSFSMGRNHELVIGKIGGRSNVAISVPDPKHKENPCAVPNTLAANVNGGVAVVKIPLFPGKLGIDFAREVTAVFDSRVNGADRLVLDLRGNPGGGAGCLRLMSLLTSDKKPVGFSLDRATATHGYDKLQFPRFDRIPRSKLEVPWLALRFARKKSVVLVTEGLGRRAFHGRVVILVNEHTTCASEMVALFAREEAGAKIVGTATPGRLVSHTGFKLGYGFTLALPVAAYVSWAGTRVDETGITPDVPVDWSYSDTRNGTDNQLRAAMAVLETL
jgi:carboxyl-terminal processing protease